MMASTALSLMGRCNPDGCTRGKHVTAAPMDGPRGPSSLAGTFGWGLAIPAGEPCGRVCSPATVGFFPVAKKSNKENRPEASGLPLESERTGDNPTVRGSAGADPVGQDAPGWTCQFCERTFSTNRGLGVHKRRAHPVETNTDAAPMMVKRRWHGEEIDLLARTEARLLAERGQCSGGDLFGALPGFGRTLEAIKGQRRREPYRALVQAHLARFGSQPGPSSGGCSAEPDFRRASGAEEAGEERCAEDAAAYDPSAVGQMSPDAARVLSELLEGAGRRRACRAMRPKTAGRRNDLHDDRTASAHKTSRQKRRAEYARVQELYKKCRSRAAAEVIDGACGGVGHSLEEMETYWRPILERVSDAPGPTPEALHALGRAEWHGGNRDYTQLWKPISVEEIKASRFDWRTSPGPDGIRSGQWRAVPVHLKAEMFNAWMARGEIPEILRQCRTVFVPKVERPGGPGEYRPISIASIPLRHFHSILARRLLACCPPDARQRGFICADGTLENSAVLDAVLGDSRKKLRECHVAVLDFAKAFDTVSHEALVELLRLRGMPEQFCGYIAHLYDTASTTLAVNNEMSSPVKVGRGVRQGDPLSPILFNVVMDLILASLPERVGYRLEMELVSALAYADDLVLLAGSKVGMQESISAVDCVGRQMGLRLNCRKSAVLSMIPDGHRKKHHYLTERTFNIGGKPLRQVSCVERWRYLGVDFEASGCVTLEHSISSALNNISRAPLKPQQRLEILRAHLIPRFQHGFVLGNISDDRLRMLDVQIRKAVGQWLRLPADVPKAYYHAAVQDGGLAIPSVRATIPDLIVRRFGGLDSSPWSVARAAAKSDKIRKKLRWAWKQLRRFSRVDSTTQRPSVRLFWREHLHASVDGRELRESTRTPTSTKWIRERCAQITGRDFVQFVHTHINALPSRIRGSRGRRGGGESSLTCRAGCKVRETTAHILQQCHRTHGGRILRHNKIVSFVAKAMEENKWTVELEPRLRTSVGLRKPDIIASRDGVGVIVDVQVVSGQRSLDELHREKRNKYGNHGELVELVAGRLGLPKAECVRATSCTISWRGVWSLTSYKELRSIIGLREPTLQIVPILALRGSHMNWTRFNQMTSVMGGGVG
uniref:Reverse transcriptase-like protein n=1 Tax=Bombyx mori TaxID=7091 RepID=V9H052_BOMMO|nr:reverse transcriptase-like protein - silkworm [Bombyx mori]AAB59214.1 reverse transcriptase-like protein [Bombyx mori]8GH6_A Chain A, Reverse transcriptase-like protein [Bombyx mori]